MGEKKLLNAIHEESSRVKHDHLVGSLKFKFVILVYVEKRLNA